MFHAGQIQTSVCVRKIIVHMFKQWEEYKHFRGHIAPTNFQLDLEKIGSVFRKYLDARRFIYNFWEKLYLKGKICHDKTKDRFLTCLTLSQEMSNTLQKISSDSVASGNLKT